MKENGRVWTPESVFENQRRRDLVRTQDMEAGVFGFFQPFQSMKAWTRAEFLQDPAGRTEVFVRFSRSGLGDCFGEAGDIRGFFVKFYTRRGNYDVTGLNVPLFFIRDPLKYGDLIRALDPAAASCRPDPEKAWDFCSRCPETLNLIVRLLGEGGTVRDYGEMDGHGVNTFVWEADGGERRLVKYHFLSRRKKGAAAEASGTDRDAAARRLYEALRLGEALEYEFAVQMMDLETAWGLEFDPLDCTKIWPEDRFPLVRAGLLTLNRNPEDQAFQVDQAVFDPGSLVPGISLSGDMMLQGRIFACADAARRRLGEDYQEIAVNRPAAKEEELPQEGEKEYAFCPPVYTADNLREPSPAFRIPGKADDFSQAAAYWRELGEEKKERLAAGAGRQLALCSPAVRERELELFWKTDRDLADRVRACLSGYGFSQ